MRLTIVNFSRRKIGGVEHNLDAVLPDLERRGHALQFVYFHDQAENRAAVRTGPGTELVDAGQCGFDLALARVRAFRPDLINVHGEIDPAFQSELLAIAPAAYSVHNHYGTCISGLKSFQFPVIEPCRDQFGPACLAKYPLRRCGGSNPATMLRLYSKGRKTLDVIRRYDAVITHSAYMEAEYLRHGVERSRLFPCRYEVSRKAEGATGGCALPPVTERVRLLFVGRMERRKGGHVLLQSLISLGRALGRPIELHFAGDGPERANWQRLANHIVRRASGIRVEFHGWLAGASLEDRFRSAHLLVQPSLWPEPFGKAGLEAGHYGVPVAAFAAGGITEWLTPGVNGTVAPATPPTPEGLAEAIADAVSNPLRYAKLREGAALAVKSFDLHAHVDNLMSIFEHVCTPRAA